MTNKTSLVDAKWIIETVLTQQSGTVVCVRSFACQDEDTGVIFDFKAGTTFVDADHVAAAQFPENFAPSDVVGGTPSFRALQALLRGELAPSPAQVDNENLDAAPPPEPDVRGLLVCIKGFEFQDPDTGRTRYALYGHDYIEHGSWLDVHYPECFIAVEDVLPSDRIPHLPLAVTA